MSKAKAWHFGICFSSFIHFGMRIFSNHSHFLNDHGQISPKPSFPGGLVRNRLRPPHRRCPLWVLALRVGPGLAQILHSQSLTKLPAATWIFFSVLYKIRSQSWDDKDALDVCCLRF